VQVVASSNLAAPTNPSIAAEGRRARFCKRAAFLQLNVFVSSSLDDYAHSSLVGGAVVFRGIGLGLALMTCLALTALLAQAAPDQARTTTVIIGFRG
jgi:hypothetical protein